MKFWNKFLLVVAVLYVCASVWPAIAAEDAVVDNVASDTADLEGSSESLVPESTDMNLAFAEGSETMPAMFRGGDPDSSLVHCLEDVHYEKHEHSLIYEPEAAALAEGAQFESEPNITWDTKVKDADGNWITMESKNTNIATEGGKFFTPAEYQIGNGGARQVSEPSGGADDEVADDNGDGAEGGNDGDLQLADADGAAGGTKTVTAQQSMGVLVHDCTSPDLWVAFQEGAGQVDMAETKRALKQDMALKIIANLGRPFSNNGEDFEDASYLFVDEGREDERDHTPASKTARLSVAGPLFNERGALKFESKIVKSSTLDADTQTRRVHISGGEGENDLRGVFVRRNVPFIFAAMSIDNGDNRASLGDVACKLEFADGTDVPTEGEGYMFRVPNYPRSEYEDQPEYFLVAKGSDKDGNVTTMRLPLLVVNTQVAYEGGSNR